MEKPPDKNKEFFKCIKVPLKYISKQETTIQVINETVIKANKIVINTLQFIKLFCIEQYNKDKTLPEINEDFINAVMKTLCIEPIKGTLGKKMQELRKPLKEFYNNEFIKLITTNPEKCIKLYKFYNTIPSISF